MCVVVWISLGVLKHLKLDVYRVRRISRVFQESFEDVSGVFEGSCTGDSGGFQEVPRCF